MSEHTDRVPDQTTTSPTLSQSLQITRVPPLYSRAGLKSARKTNKTTYTYMYTHSALVKLLLSPPLPPYSLSLPLPTLSFLPYSPTLLPPVLFLFPTMTQAHPVINATNAVGWWGPSVTKRAVRFGSVRGGEVRNAPGDRTGWSDLVRSDAMRRGVTGRG